MTRTRPGPRRSLSEEQLLDAALRLLDAKGVEGLSVRGLAAEVGVAPNAVYTYFPDKAAVLAGVVERVLGRVAVGAFADSGPSWRERVVALAEAVRAELLAHPGAVPLLFSVPLTGPNALAVGETLLAVLADAGLGPEDAARASYLLTVHVLGSVALEVAELDEPGPPPPEEERVAARAAAFAAVPAERYPRSAGVAATMARYVTSEQFRWGLDRVLDGLTPG